MSDRIPDMYEVMLEQQEDKLTPAEQSAAGFYIRKILEQIEDGYNGKPYTWVVYGRETSKYVVLRFTLKGWKSSIIECPANNKYVVSVDFPKDI